MNKGVLIVLAVILPPVSVFLQKGAGQDLVINIVATLLGGIPGVIHALWLTLS